MCDPLNRGILTVIVLGLAFGAACSPSGSDEPASPTNDAVETGHGAVSEPKDERSARIGIPLDPTAGSEIGWVFEAYLSPQQEAGEEEDVPTLAPAAFRSVAPSIPREERPGRGHGVVAFTRDFSRAYVEVAIRGIAPEDIVMFHLHCGKPGQLGPILVDFGSTGDLAAYFADGLLAYEVTNRDLERVIEQGEGVVGAFTAGCPIIPAVPMDRIRTIGGMATVAAQGELYFNLHTRGQTFFGDIRGQLLPIDPSSSTFEPVSVSLDGGSPAP